jgi:pimeloyl-ACP methyl ester carboxylesterase
MINNIRMAYSDVGSGAPVLFLHAFPLSGAMWQGQVEALRATHRLIVPDLRGFGATDAPPGPYSMDQQSDDVVALLDHLGLEQVTVVGLSMGGYIAFALLRRHPQRVRALVLADTRAGADDAIGQARREANARIAETQGAAAIAELMLPNLVAPNASQAVRDTLQNLIVGTSPDGIAGALRGMAQRPDSTPDLATIQVPTLIIVGADDALTPPSEAQILHAGIAGSRLVIIPECGHMANLEQPAAFNAALGAFLG